MPEDRADAFLRMIRRAQRGKLKIYLGYCAGVGKTYQMLLEGHRLMEQGIDVIVGLLETHGRADIVKLAQGLEIVPRRRQDYRGIALEEMDIDAVLARRPQLALVDELAHTNAPGSRNAKRYEDVQDLLAAGIHVITTMNVQHLESLYGTVEAAVGVKVRERLPDSVLVEADEIVDVDLSTEDLRKRLAEGRIYPQDRIGAALTNFFTATNLERLRELTLRELASQIDLRRRQVADDEDIKAPDQVMVCLSSHGPNSHMLLRYASRLAGRLNRNWYAVYVQTRSEAATVIDARTQRVLSETLTLAKQLGAMVFTYRGDDIVETILSFAREYRVGHIVVGSPRRLPFWRRWGGRRDIVRSLIERARGMTVIVLDTRTGERMRTKTAPEASEDKQRSNPQDAAEPGSERALTLSGTLSSASIVIWKTPVTKETVLRALTASFEDAPGLPVREELYGAVMRREDQGSTFLNEGVAFPHVRVPGLGSPLIALGLTNQGVSDIATQKPVEIVFLILSPAETPEVQVKLLGLASRAAQNRHLLQNLRAARSPEEALRLIAAWEAPAEADVVS
jgi:two-component system sensor histidine kinase KdpD